MDQSDERVDTTFKLGSRWLLELDPNDQPEPDYIGRDGRYGIFGGWDWSDNVVPRVSYRHLSAHLGDEYIMDQIIPGGTLLGYANADRWSVALPLENKNLLISETIQAPQQFPRNVLLQALLVYVTEALEAKQE